MPALTTLPGVKTEIRKILFCLSSEVNCEYEVNGISYKNHHLLYAPDFETAHRINKILSQYGDLSLDGRPTLSLSAYHLLETILHISPKAYFVPAHVWTPWFSALGSKNGHESIEDCFKDLTNELFAVETSLSADPLMCRRYSGLDRFTLMSNSDAHAAYRLGREVNLLNAELSYDGLFNAVKSKNGFLGTYEYYPQRGKYFNDGHRNCNISINPEIIHNSICPICKKPLTIGVARRIEQLADRSVTEAKKMVQPFKSVLPLPEIISEIAGFSEDSLKVKTMYAKAIAAFGSEFIILQQAPLNDIQSHNRKLSIAIRRLREDKKYFTAGYDGVRGRISFFKENELEQMNPAQTELF